LIEKAFWELVPFLCLLVLKLPRARAAKLNLKERLSVDRSARVSTKGIAICEKLTDKLRFREVFGS